MLMIMGRCVIESLRIHSDWNLFLTDYSSPYFVLSCRRFIWKGSETRSVW